VGLVWSGLVGSGRVWAFSWAACWVYLTGCMDMCMSGVLGVFLLFFFFFSSLHSLTVEAIHECY